MSISAYATAMGVVRTSMLAGNYTQARRDLLVARTHAAETPDGNFDGAAYKLRTAELDKLAEGIQFEIDKGKAGSGDRIINTRTNFPRRRRARGSFGY